MIINLINDLRYLNMIAILDKLYVWLAEKTSKKLIEKRI